jgi:hypothetical protein
MGDSKVPEYRDCIGRKTEEYVWAFKIAWQGNYRIHWWYRNLASKDRGSGTWESNIRAIKASWEKSSWYEAFRIWSIDDAIQGAERSIASDWGKRGSWNPWHGPKVFGWVTEIRGLWCYREPTSESSLCSSAAHLEDKESKRGEIYIDWAMGLR